MNINDLTIGQLKEIQNFSAGRAHSDHPYKIGQKYFIRTVTMHFTGELVDVFDKELVIKDAAWIADSGRFGESLRTGEFNEIEAYPDGNVIIGRGSLIDMTPINIDLPRESK